MRGGKILKTGLPHEVVEELTIKEKNKMLKEET
jgi:methyl coenzyme M reductase system subunit A2